jgi:tetratricopeptide (TPR) repeat protein
MRKIFLLLILTFIKIVTFAQNKEDAKKLVAEGVAYHDKGDYDGAITRYDKALELDKDNLVALSEKAMSLLLLEKYNESIQCCQKAIEKHPAEKILKTIYVTYGNDLDALNKTDKSIEVYDEGIKQFPDYYQLYFNKGITLSSVNKYDEACVNFQKAIAINPKHASSHNALARILNIQKKRIPALLAYCRFFVIEPQSKRATENLENVQKIVKGDVEKTGKKELTVHISSDMLGDTLANGKPKENSFKSTGLILAMDAALDFDKKNSKKTDAEQFIRKFESVCASLKETKADNYGFYWDYYVPYFTEMQDKKLIETLGYIVFASSDSKDVAKWLKSHQAEIDEFYEWSKNYAWKTN